MRCAKSCTKPCKPPSIRSQLKSKRYLETRETLSFTLRSSRWPMLWMALLILLPMQPTLKNSAASKMSGLRSCVVQTRGHRNSKTKSINSLTLSDTWGTKTQLCKNKSTPENKKSPGSIRPTGEDRISMMLSKTSTLREFSKTMTSWRTFCNKPQASSVCISTWTMPISSSTKYTRSRTPFLTSRKTTANLKEWPRSTAKAIRTVPAWVKWCKKIKISSWRRSYPKLNKGSNKLKVKTGN